MDIGTILAQKKNPPHTPQKENITRNALPVTRIPGKRKMVQKIAARLAEKLGDDGNMMFYLKCGWRLPEAVIWDICERAASKQNPRKYFTACASDEMGAR